MTFGQKVIDFYQRLEDTWNLPGNFQTIFPFKETEVQQVMSSFYSNYFSDQSPRIFLYGINPGRFGAGITGISFTDPVILEDYCQISNTFHKRHETSSLFIKEVIESWGGLSRFYQHFYITSICPIGFIKEGKNANYYDDKALETYIEKDMIEMMWEQIRFGANRQIAFSIGRGDNYKRLKKLNDQHGFFQHIEPLPHPRWVMQYRRKKMDTFVDEYIIKLQKSLEQ